MRMSQVLASEGTSPRSHRTRRRALAGAAIAGCLGTTTLALPSHGRSFSSWVPLLSSRVSLLPCSLFDSDQYRVHSSCKRRRESLRHHRRPPVHRTSGRRRHACEQFQRLQESGRNGHDHGGGRSLRSGHHLRSTQRSTAWRLPRGRRALYRADHPARWLGGGRQSPDPRRDVGYSCCRMLDRPEQCRNAG